MSEHKNHRAIVSAAILVVFSVCGLVMAAEKALDKEITRLSAVKGLHSLKKFYSVPNFKIGGKYEFGKEAAYEFGGEGGTTLESLGRKPLQTAYIAVGTPKKDDKGKITNAVLISSYYSGDATNMYFFWYEGQMGNPFSKGAVVGPGKLIDTDKYYVVFVDALGLWGASKPSGGLGMKFPKYSYLDYVQANYRLLKDELGVAKVKLATGVSMGGAQSYILAVLHPDFVEAIMPVGGFVKRDPVNAWLFQNMTAAMQSDPVWQRTKGDYYSLPKKQHPNQGMMFGWSILGQTALTFDFRNKQKWDTVKQDVFFWEPKEGEGAKLLEKANDYDVNDLLYRNAAGATYDISGQLGNIKAKTLIIHVKNDQWLRWAMAEKAAKSIPGAKLVGYESPLAHYGIFRGPNVVKDDVEAFFKEISM